MVNPQSGHLAFKIFSFENISCFDHIQRLGYYSMILVHAGGGKLNADLSAYDFSENMLMCFSPYQPFMMEARALGERGMRPFSSRLLLYSQTPAGNLL